MILKGSWNNLKVGDVVTAYYAGVWEILEIGPIRKYDNQKEPPLVKLKKLYTKRHAPVNKEQTSVCDITWCEKIPENKLESLKKFSEVFYGE